MFKLDLKYINQIRKESRKYPTLKPIEANSILHGIVPMPRIDIDFDRETFKTQHKNNLSLKHIYSNNKDNKFGIDHYLIEDQSNKPFGKIRTNNITFYDELEVFYEDDYINILIDELEHIDVDQTPAIKAVINSHIKMLSRMASTKDSMKILQEIRKNQS